MNTKVSTPVKKERTYLFSPNIDVSTVIRILGPVQIDDLKAAILEAVSKNEILNAKIQIQSDGSASYVSSDRSDISIPIYVTTDAWKKIVIEQQKIRLNIESGELIRFFLIPGENEIQLVVIAHHLTGDGLSMSYLIEDIMNALSGNKVPYKPITLLNPDNCCNVKAVSSFTKWMTKKLNHQWNKTGTIFQFSDYERLFHKYWTSTDLEILSHTITSDKMQSIKQYSKVHHVTINSILLTAFIKAAGDRQDVGISASIRPKENKSMGNYATGISIQYQYNQKKSFCDNVKCVQERVYLKLNDDRKKLFLLQFMNGLSETLIDAAYFSAYDGYSNKSAKMVQNMFGYRDNPKGLSVTNLTKLPISANYGNYSIANYKCILPLVPNGKRMIGIATLGETLELCLTIQKDGSNVEDRTYFDNVIKVIEQLA